MSQNDDGIYTCHAVNDIGEAKHNFRVMSEFFTAEMLYYMQQKQKI